MKLDLEKLTEDDVKEIVECAKTVWYGIPEGPSPMFGAMKRQLENIAAIHKTKKPVKGLWGSKFRFKEKGI